MVYVSSYFLDLNNDYDNEMIFISILIYLLSYIYILQTIEVRKSQEVIDLYI